MAMSALQTLLGVALVAHGLANAVLPLRGVDSTGAGDWSLAIALVYVLAIIGFVKAGLGLLGVRPLSGNLGLTVAIAGLCSLGAQILLGDADLWFGVALSLTLPVA